MKSTGLIYGLLLFAASFAHSQEAAISFCEEHIDFELDSSYFSINGIYSFYNPWDKIQIQTIVFPFSGDIHQIDSISVIDLNGLVRLPYIRQNRAISFIISVLPQDTLDVNIFYRQKTALKNSYILTSTQAWKQPLKKASYVLTSSIPIVEKQLSYSCFSKKEIKDKYYYLWKMEDFMPDKDFDVIIME